MAADLKLDPDHAERVHHLAAARRRPADALVREAIEQYLERQEKVSESDPAPPAHPSGQPWPRRSPVGGIITPL